MRYPVQLFFGKSFTGKTARMLDELAQCPRVILVDPKCAQLASLPRYHHFWPEYGPLMKRWMEGEAQGFVDFLKAKQGRPFRCVLHFRGWFRENLELVCWLAMAAKDVVLAVDELGLFVPPGPPGMLFPKITSLVVSGTHEAVFFMGTAQRPNLVHATVRANASRIFFYRLAERNDLEAARNYLPDELLSQLSRLPDYVCIEWTDGGDPFVDASMVGRIRVPGARHTHTLKTLSRG